MSARRRPRHPSPGAHLAVCGIGARGEWGGKAHRCADLHTTGSVVWHGRYRQLRAVRGIPVPVPRRIDLNPGCRPFQGAAPRTTALFRTTNTASPHHTHISPTYDTPESWGVVPNTDLLGFEMRADVPRAGERDIHPSPDAHWHSIRSLTCPSARGPITCGSRPRHRNPLATSRLTPLVVPAPMQVLVAQKVTTGVYKGVTTSELDELAAETAAALTSQHPDYALVSGCTH